MKTAQTKQTKHLNKKLIAAAVATTAVLFSSVAVGAKGHRYDNHDNRYYDQSNIDFAKVISVDDVVERVEYSEPVENCYNKKVRVKRDRYYSSRSGYESRTPDVLGAVIGAAVGNQVGKKGSSSGRRVATVAGAILGGSIGRDVRKRDTHSKPRRAYHDSHHGSYQTVRHCETSYQTHYKNKVVGYDVKYRYRGKVYSTHMSEHPGERIKVKVNVTPVYS